MNSIKNLLVVVLLMGVSYGAFRVINSPDPTLSDDVPEIEEIDIDIGAGWDDPTSTDTDPMALSSDEVSSPTAPSSLPSMPPRMPSSPAPEQADNLELPDLDMTAPPAAVQIPTTPPSQPAGSNDFSPAPTSDVANSSPYGAERGNNQFQPTPQTNLQPVAPKPLGEIAEQQISELGTAVEEQTNQMAQAGSQFVDEQLQPARDAATVAQQQLGSLNEKANGFLAGVQEQLAPVGSALPMEPPRGVASESTPPLPSTIPVGNSIDWAGLNQMINEGNVRQSLQSLSQYYNADLPADQRMQMLQWLDQLAGKVIYSTEHHLDSRPYIVADGDTLESLASAWNVPPQLIYNINHGKIGDSATLVAGSELKKVQGPFNARISLDRQEMTLFLDNMYAGRFPIELGHDHEYPTGSFMIDGKTEAGRQYQDSSGGVIAAEDASNPYGKFWLGFSNSDLCIHESPVAGNSADMRGCIRLSSRDAADVYGILSDGSQVSIIR